jgi:hypothetical protein
MSTVTAHTDNPHTGGRSRFSKVTEILIELLALGAASTGFAYIALSLAPGVTHPSDSIPGTQEISFIHEGWWLASLLLCVPLFLFTRRWRSLWLGSLAAVVLTVPQFWATEVNLNRWAESGLGDGLEGFAIFVPWFMLFVFFMAAVVGRVMATPATTPATTGPSEAS